MSFGLLRASLSAQQVEPQTVTTSVVRGIEPASSIHYVMIPLSGRVLAGTAATDQVPRLTAQCTQTPDGRQRFELLMDLGDVTTLRFVAPWHQTRESLYPPQLSHVPVTMEFLGYTKVKPVKRTWERMDELHQELRYSNPGISSPNMESIAFYLQYLRALPTLHLTFANTAANVITLEFVTAPWLEQIRKEPLCKASGL